MKYTLELITKLEDKITILRNIYHELAFDFNKNNIF
jgi:hypothetical protein